MLGDVYDVAFVIVSGLPGSGKSTLGRMLAEHLQLPIIAKDAILEALFDSLGVGDHAWRSRLSRASDEVLLTVAANTAGAVLDNWWHHDWAEQHLPNLGGHLIEIYCDCPVEVAAARFRRRRRHRGHLDPDLTDEQAAERIAAMRVTFRGPLRLGGPLLIVDTTQPVDAEAIVYALRCLIPARRQPVPLDPTTLG